MEFYKIAIINTKLREWVVTVTPEDHTLKVLQSVEVHLNNSPAFITRSR
jgi:DNA-directed RNA polymerase subunit L